MAATIVDVLSADLTLVGIGLLNSPEEFNIFRNEVNAEVQVGLGLSVNVSPGVAEPNRTFSLDRDRIVVNVSSGRTSITKEYPALEERSTDLSRLSFVAWRAIASTNVEDNKPIAFGYNLALVVDPQLDETAIKYLGDRLFGDRTPIKDGWSLVGGTGRLIFADGSREWTFTTEPRPSEDHASKRVFLAVNLHIPETRWPEQNEILNSFEKVWDTAIHFINKLHDSG